jgi:hypothetical protein
MKGNANFVRQQRTARCRLEKARTILAGAGERTPNVAEQFAFQRTSGTAAQVTCFNAALRQSRSKTMSFARD